MVLDVELFRSPSEMRRILLHEVFHFVWIRLGNRIRIDYERLIKKELIDGVQGELGWSAEGRKNELGKAEYTRRTRRWRAYICESFCDTAAWSLAGRRKHPEYTLGLEAANKRRTWFEALLARGPLPV